ncbi:hypothetical protein [Buttiauxella gaviniae]|uniref:hypothetical protein n=1 Tax=Buttiauxella gaviniae TaxID=82990 RepID=UPI003C73C096
MKIFFGLLFLITSNVVFSQCPVAPINQPNDEARKLSVNGLSKFMVCHSGDREDRSPCNTFASQGLSSIWGISDFGTDNNTFLSANQIWEKVNSSGSKWSSLGDVFDEDNNLCAQSLANSGWAVIAVMKGTNNGHGHVALVIPGELQKVPSWGMLAANSASFLLDEPTKGYISKPLSFAFSKTKASEARFFYQGRRIMHAPNNQE